MFGKKKEMSPAEKKAKLSALKEAHSMASDAMKEGLAGAKKVSVSADSKEGLEKGLDMAKKIIDKQPEMGESEDEDSMLGEQESDVQDSYESEQEDSMPMDEEDIDAEIQKLMELKEKLKKY